MIVQYVSDLHLEFRKKQEIPTIIKKNKNAEILILAGDISAIGDSDTFKIFMEFLIYYSKHYNYIFHVSGNHEYYNNTKKNILTINDIDKKLKCLEQIYSFYKYLNCKSFKYKDVFFIGATLWTHVPLNLHFQTEKTMNDYQNIFVNSYPLVKFKISDMQIIHNNHKNYLKQQINYLHRYYKNPKIVVITHHKPILESTDYAYETDMSNIFSNKISVSISGHTHKYMEKKINNVLYLANCKGYPHQKTLFVPDKSFLI